MTRDAHIARLIEGKDSSVLLSEIPSYIPQVELLRAYLFEALKSPETNNGPQFRELLEMKVDLSFPMDILEESVKTEIRKAKMERLESAAGFEIPKRVWLHKTDYQLKVYDLAKDGKTFTEIKGVLKKRHVSTVKSAYLAVTEKINSVRPIGEGVSASDETLTKKSLPLAGFDPEEHSSRCTTCRNANLPEKMCPQARAYMNQDHVSERAFFRNIDNFSSEDTEEAENEVSEDH